MAYGKVQGIPKALTNIPPRIYPLTTTTSPTKAAILTVLFDFTAGDKVDPALEQELCNDFTK
jgi:hypothetical protein